MSNFLNSYGYYDEDDYILSQFEIKQVEDYVEFTSRNTKVLYDYMFKLDFVGDRNTVEFNKRKKQIKVIQEYEEQKIRDMNLDSRKCYAIIRYLIQKHKIRVYEDLFETTINNFNRNKAVVRTILLMHNIINKEVVQNKEKEYLDMLLNALSSQSISKDPDSVRDKIVFKEKIQEKVQTCILLDFLALIQCQDDNSYKYSFYETKYDLGFYNQSIQDYLFEIFRENPTKHNTLEESYKDDYCFDLASYQMERLLCINSESYEDTHAFGITKLRELYLKAILMNLNPAHISRLKEKFHSSMKSSKYIDDSKSRELISLAFANTYDDKVMCRII